MSRIPNSLSTVSDTSYTYSLRVITGIAQVSGTYGHADAQTIVENCGKTRNLRCSASENGGTARFASRLIGERKIIREQTTESRSGSLFANKTRSVSTSHHHVT